MKRFHTAFQGPARIFLAKRRAVQMLTLQRRLKETKRVGAYEYLNTIRRRQLWLMRSSMRTALASGKSKVGGLISITLKEFKILLKLILYKIKI